MSDLLLVNARLVTLGGHEGPRHGTDMSALGVIERGWATIDGTRISAVGEGDPPEDAQADATLDCEGRAVLPAWVDCHSHACWAGSRIDEWAHMLAGTAYLDILAAGGGIMATVRAVRKAPVEVLSRNLLERIGRHRLMATGTLEVKSGYGLTTESELKMLRAIHDTSLMTDLLITGTFLGAHAIDPDDDNFVDRVITETLPAVASEFPGIPCDVYLETGAWSLADTRRYLEAAVDLSCPVRLHADQFNSLGGVPLAVELGARSVDHLEATTPEDAQRLGASSTIGVLLPVSGFHVDQRWADGRQLIDAGAAVAVATNDNPGSAPSPSMGMALGLSCRRNGLSPAEAICAATWNAACVLGLEDEVGAIAPGMRANLQILDTNDERVVCWEVAPPPPPVLLMNGAPARFEVGGPE
ncbi:MAG: imidazolonepropionase [Phycisphaerales bacterium]|nr:imidazolonepropionase [Phycisphaerales bacterium]